MKRRSFITRTTAGAAGLFSASRLPELAGSELANRSSGLIPSSGNGPVKIAVVQQNGNPGKADENRRKALSYAEQTLKEKADIILFS